MINPDYTIVLSGPLTTHGPLMGALQRDGARVEPGRNSHGLADDDPSQGWITVRAQDVDKIGETAGLASWSLRMHQHTPMCRACGGLGCDFCDGDGYTNKHVPSPEEMLRAELDDMKTRLAALEGKG